MAINFDDFAVRDVFLHYDFEEVTYRWDHNTRTVYVKFYGEPEHPEPVEPSNRPYTEALRFGCEISEEEYERGFARG